VKKFFATCVCALLAVPLSSLCAHGALWGTDASGDLSGNRTSHIDGGIDATHGWAAGNFKISWKISENDGTWTYVYSVTGGEKKDISHFILEVTDDGQPLDILPGTDTEIDPDSPKTYSASDPSNPFMPNPIYGVKFDFGGDQVDYTIVTNRSPVYGVFYGKDGKDGGDWLVAWSSALGFDNYKTNDTLTATDFIVRPNGVCPIPAGVWLLGSGLMVLIR